MVEIIKHGKNKSIRYTTCMYCDCIFSYTKDDCWWDRPLCEHRIDCPECGKTIGLGDLDNE